MYLIEKLSALRNCPDRFYTFRQRQWLKRVEIKLQIKASNSQKNVVFRSINQLVSQLVISQSINELINQSLSMDFVRGLSSEVKTGKRHIKA